MKSFFIRKEKLLKILLISLIIFNISSYFIIIPWCLILIGYFLVHRKNNVDYKEVINLQPDVILSPASGRILEILDDVNDEFHGVSGTKIRIGISWKDPFGLYLPFSGTVQNVESFEGKSLYRYTERLTFTNGYNRLNIAISNKSGCSIYMELLSCILGRKPKIWIEAGDKGKVASCIGYFSFGGSVVITLPKSSELFCKVGDTLSAGETVIGGLKG